jgi:hypothetical protein
MKMPSTVKKARVRLRLISRTAMAKAFQIMARWSQIRRGRL